MQLIIEVPDDSPLAEEINSWEDGAAYNLGVTQTATGAFALNTAEPAEVVEEDVPAPDAKYKNPAMSKMMASKTVPK